MPKKKENKESTLLSPEEVSKYVPENPIPKIQNDMPLGLDSVFALAKNSGASVIGEAKNNAALPQNK